MGDAKAGCEGGLSSPTLLRITLRVPFAPFWLEKMFHNNAKISKEIMMNKHLILHYIKKFSQHQK